MLRIVDWIRCDLDNEGKLTCSFEDWCKDSTGVTWTDKQCSMLCNGSSEEDVAAAKEELLEEFFGWCETWGVEGIEI